MRQTRDARRAKPPKGKRRNRKPTDRRPPVGMGDAIWEAVFGPLSELPDPRQYQTDIPELVACPLTRDEHDQVLECMRAVDPIFARGVSVRMRMEFASAMLASACAIAYGSAEAQGQPSMGPFRFASAENLIIRRAKELYAQGRA